MVSGQKVGFGAELSGWLNLPAGSKGIIAMSVFPCLLAYLLDSFLPCCLLACLLPSLLACFLPSFLLFIHSRHSFIPLSFLLSLLPSVHRSLIPTFEAFVKIVSNTLCVQCRSVVLIQTKCELEVHLIIVTIISPAVLRALGYTIAVCSRPSFRVSVILYVPTSYI